MTEARRDPASLLVRLALCLLAVAVAGCYREGEVRPLGRGALSYRSYLSDTPNLRWEGGRGSRIIDEEIYVTATNRVVLKREATNLRLEPAEKEAKERWLIVWTGATEFLASNSARSREKKPPRFFDTLTGNELACQGCSQDVTITTTADCGWSGADRYFCFNDDEPKHRAVIDLLSFSPTGVKPQRLDAMARDAIHIHSQTVSPDQSTLGWLVCEPTCTIHSYELATGTYTSHDTHCLWPPDPNDVNRGELSLLWSGNVPKLAIWSVHKMAWEDTHGLCPDFHGHLVEPGR